MGRRWRRLRGEVLFNKPFTLHETSQAASLHLHLYQHLHLHLHQHLHLHLHQHFFRHWHLLSLTLSCNLHPLTLPTYPLHMCLCLPSPHLHTLPTPSHHSPSPNSSRSLSFSHSRIWSLTVGGISGFWEEEGGGKPHTSTSSECPQSRHTTCPPSIPHTTVVRGKHTLHIMRNS